MNEHQTWAAVIAAFFAGLPSLANLVLTITERRKRLDQEIEAKESLKNADLAVEAAKLAAVTAATKAEELKIAVLESKKTREEQISALAIDLQQAIKANTDMNERALDAANGVNGKILALGLENRAAAAAEGKIEAGNVSIEAKTVEIHTP